VLERKVVASIRSIFLHNGESFPINEAAVRLFELLQKSLEIDPKQAVAYQFIADAHVLRAAAGLSLAAKSPEAEFAAAAKTEEKALQLRRTAEAH
jgi:hypothetical protein